jgi:hypothetical protein
MKLKSIIRFWGLRLCCLAPLSTIFQFWYIMTRTSYISLCTWPTQLVKTFIVLVHWNNSPQVDMSVHTDTLSWLRANQFLFLLLNAACLDEKQQILILYSGMTLLRQFVIQNVNCSLIFFYRNMHDECWQWINSVIKWRKKCSFLLKYMISFSCTNV